MRLDATRVRCVLLVLLFLGTPAAGRCAQPEQLSLTWQQLGERLSAQTFRLDLRPQGFVEGTNLETPPDGFALTITRASIDSRYRKGPNEISRDRVNAIHASTGEKARLNLPDGERIEGTLLAAGSDSLVLVIRKTSDRQRYPKGQASIPRSGVSEIRLTHHKGAKGALGALAGAGGGILTTVLIATQGDDPESDAIKAGIVAPFAIVGGVVGGYLFGHRADRHVTVIRIAP